MIKDKPENEAGGEKNDSSESEKFFDEAQYRTVTVGREADDSAAPLKQAGFVKTLLSLLDSGNPTDKDNALELLKKENAVDYLMAAIRDAGSNDKKAVLLAACWESGLDFKGHHGFFMEYAFSPNPLVSLEAITVLDTNRLTIPVADLEGLINRLGTDAARAHDNAVLLEDLRLALYEQLKEVK